MRKIFLALLIIFCVNNCAFADNLKIGILTHQNMSSEEFADFIKSQERSFFGWKILNTSHSLNDEFIYFDSLTSMLMALQSGKIDEAALPEAVAEYIVNTNPAFTFACAHRSRNTHLAIGFRDDEAGRRLQQKVNEALAGMKADLTLRLITEKYFSHPNASIHAEKANFAKFDHRRTLKIAITGDLPPLDITAADGTPIGFNTAVLAEIGKRINYNICLVDIDTGARTSALMSGRVDIVFWYQVYDDAETQPDIPAGVLLSDSYYDWDKFLHLKSHEH